MKRLKFVLAILVMTLVFGLTLSGCDDGSTSNTTKFEGTWRSDTTRWYTFTGKSFSHSDPNNTNTISGTFDYTESVISFRTSDGESTYVGSYSLIDNTLTLLEGVYTGPKYWSYGTFTRQ